MDKIFFKPKEILELTIKNSETKVKMPLDRMAALGIIAGIFIATGALASSIVLNEVKAFQAGIAKILSAMTFTIGIISVVIGGSELFTGNSLMVTGILDKKIKWAELLKAWILVYLFNLIGSLIFAYMSIKTGLVSGALADTFKQIAVKKTSLCFQEAFIRGVACNFLVCLSVWLSSSSQSTTAKFFLSAFPVIIFIICGFEHSVANMMYIPMAQMLGADISISSAIVNNFIPVSLGNIAGGALLAYIYYVAYRQ